MPSVMVVHREMPICCSDTAADAGLIVRGSVYLCHAPSCNFPKCKRYCKLMHSVSQVARSCPLGSSIAVGSAHACLLYLALARCKFLFRLWKSPFQACQEIISLCLGGCGVQKNINSAWMKAATWSFNGIYDLTAVHYLKLP
uniref:Uncharacterized protein n=1 Tax=Mus musculus TaxID=10090 RepID=Q8C8D3_MOUSE|nr:unnamed protein product [Mus musculus]